MSGSDEAGRRRVARDWLSVADEDLRAAVYCASGSPPALGVAAYHCQQAAEKSLKAALVLAVVRAGKTHDLDRLAGAVARALPDLGSVVEPCRKFSLWGVAFRYPLKPGQQLNALTRAEIDEAIAGVTRLYDRVAAMIGND
jgi:hypothetical protein